MIRDVDCPQCGRMLDRGVLRTKWLTVHPEQMLAALNEAEEAEWQGRNAKVFAGTATTIAYRDIRGEKMLRCLYCPDCAVVVAARNDLIVDAPPFSRFARRASGGHTVFASRLRAWRLVRGVVAGAVCGLLVDPILLWQRSISFSRDYLTVPIVLFAGLGLCWGLWFDLRSSIRRTAAFRLKAEIEDRRRTSHGNPAPRKSISETSVSEF